MEPVGIFSAVRLSHGALERFIADHGEALVDDVQYILANARTKASILSPHGYYHHPGNKLVVQYEAATATLFYLYILELRNPEAMEQVPSLQTFRQIAGYKDIDSADLLVFSSSMPNLLSDPIWRAYVIRPGQWQVMDPAAVPKSALQALWRLAHTYYFDIGERYFNDEPEDSWRYPDNFFGRPWLERIKRPATGEAAA